MAAATGAACRVGLETAREGAHWACHYTIPQTGRNVPAHARYWRVAEALGVAGPPAAATVALSDADRYWVRDQLFGLPRPISPCTPAPLGDKCACCQIRRSRHTGGESLFGLDRRRRQPRRMAAGGRDRTTRRGAGQQGAQPGRVHHAQAVGHAARRRRFARLQRFRSHAPGGQPGNARGGVFTCTSPLLSGPDVSRLVRRRTSWWRRPCRARQAIARPARGRRRCTWPAWTSCRSTGSGRGWSAASTGELPSRVRRDTIRTATRFRHMAQGCERSELPWVPDGNDDLYPNGVPLHKFMTNSIDVVETAKQDDATPSG